MIFSKLTSRGRGKRSSQLALAIALATGAAVGSVAIAEPAYAMAKKKKGSKGSYSKEFIGAYNPLQEAVTAEAADAATIKGLIPGVVAIAQSPSEKQAVGSIIYNAGAKLNDQSLQLQGISLMLESGQTAPEQLGQFNFIAYQLSTAQGEHANARDYLQAAMDNGYVNASITPAAMRIAMAESYFSENRIDEGLDYLWRAIAAEKAAGQPVSEQWYRRGLSFAYNNNHPMVYDFMLGWINDYPSAGNWRDAVNITRNLTEFDASEMLDLLRLGYRLDTLQDKQEYIDYIEAADPRRLPKEVETIIKNGYATGRVSKDDIYVADSLRVASGRIATDRAELPALERDARAESANVRTVVAAGDAFLSYGQYAKAEEFYQKAVSMPGADTALVLTRLGIAQSELGKTEEASETFTKVQGARQAIARLWAAYIAGKSAPVAPATTQSGD